MDDNYPVALGNNTGNGINSSPDILHLFFKSSPFLGLGNSVTANCENNCSDQFLPPAPTDS